MVVYSIKCKVIDLSCINVSSFAFDFACSVMQTLQHLRTLFCIDVRKYIVTLSLDNIFGWDTFRNTVF